jgi:branched-chain amino acid transport system permease protein
MRRNVAGYLPVGLLAILVFILQVVLKTSGKEYFLTQITMSVYYSILIVGLCILMGYAGQISLGHAGFFAMGGYITAVLTTFNLLPYADSPVMKIMDMLGMFSKWQDLYGTDILSVRPIYAGIFAVLFTIVAAYLIGIPVLKLKGHYLAMATLGFGIIIYRVVLGTPLFGEADGISDVPPFGIIGPLRVSGDMSERVMNYYIAWGLLLIGVLFLINLVNSRVGRALRAIHGAEDAADAMGVDTSGYKLRTFILSAVYAAVAGVFLTHYNGGIGPSEASVMKSVRYVAIVAIGGMANIWGALVMGLLLNFLSLRGYFGSYDDAVFGGILIVIMLFAPEGPLRREFFTRVIGALRGEREAQG